jgi:hypothetical protein
VIAVYKYLFVIKCNHVLNFLCVEMRVKCFNHKTRAKGDRDQPQIYIENNVSNQ